MLYFDTLCKFVVYTDNLDFILMDSIKRSWFVKMIILIKRKNIADKQTNKEIN